MAKIRLTDINVENGTSRQVATIHGGKLIFSNINQSDIDGLDTALLEKANTADLSEVAITGSFSDLSDKPTTMRGFGITDGLSEAEVGVPGGVAQLDANGHIPTSQISVIAAGAYKVAEDESEMLSLSVPEGTVVIRPDEEKTYIRNSGTTGTMSDYTDFRFTHPVISSVNGKNGNVVINSDDVGLGMVDNTSDLDKPISTLTQDELDLKAPLESPTFTGTVTVPTPVNNSDAATKKYVDDFTVSITGSSGIDAVATGNSYNLSLANVNTTAGFYGTSAGHTVSFSVDTKGRVFNVSQNQITIPWNMITSKPTTLSNMGITDGVNINTYLRGALSARPNPGTPGRMYFATDTGSIYYDSGSWRLMTTELTGDVTRSAGTSITTLSATGVVPGNYKSVTVDAKGRVTMGYNPSTLSGLGIVLTASDVTTALGSNQVPAAASVPWSGITGKPTTLAGYGITDAGGPGGGGPSIIRYSISGPVEPVDSPPRWYPDRTMTITGVYFSLGTPNEDGATVIDVNVNGVSIFGSIKPTCNTTQYKSTFVTVEKFITVDDYVTVSVTTSGGKDATVCIVYS